MFDSIKGGMDAAKVEAIKRAIEDAGVYVTGLKISFDGDSVILKGSVETSDDYDTITEAVEEIVDDVDNQITADDDESDIHVVESGDTLYSIAEEYYEDGDRYMEIYNANKDVIGKNPDLIKVGQKLRIP